MLHASPISSSFILSPKSYLLRNTKPEVPRYAVFSSLLWLPLSYTQICSSLFSDIFTLCFSFNVRVVGCLWHWILRLWACIWYFAVVRLVWLFLLPPSPADWTLEGSVFLQGTDCIYQTASRCAPAPIASTKLHHTVPWHQLHHTVPHEYQCLLVGHCLNIMSNAARGFLL
jgi:hypothetical protein